MSQRGDPSTNHKMNAICNFCFILRLSFSFSECAQSQPGNDEILICIILVELDDSRAPKREVRTQKISRVHNTVLWLIYHSRTCDDINANLLNNFFGHLKWPILDLFMT